MAEKNIETWFPAKKYGWGWGLPCCWQGWLVFGTYLAAVGLLPFIFNPRHNAEVFYLALAFLTLLLLMICYAKGEELKWRWGKNK